MQIAPPVDGRLAARGIYRVGDNKKCHVQTNDEGARKNSKERINGLTPFPAGGSFERSLVVIGFWKKQLYTGYKCFTYPVCAVFEFFFTAALNDHDYRKGTGKGKNEIILLKRKQTNKNELSLFDEMHFDAVESFSNNTNLKRKATVILAKLMMIIYYAP